MPRRRRALTPLVPLVDECFNRGKLLKEKGWYSFEPYWKFRQSLCTADEWETYKKYAIESDKEALGNYRSEFLNGLRANYANEEEVFRAISCERVYEDLRKTTGYEIAWRPFDEEQMRLRQHEIELHATDISRVSAGDEQLKRVRIWVEVVKKMAGPLGFQTSSTLSSYRPPVFRRVLTSTWNVVLGVDATSLGSETAETVAKPSGMGTLPIGQQATWLALSLHGRSTINPGDAELIFVPQMFFPLGRAYRNFWDLEGLEINIRAEMTALQLIWADLEPRLIEGVSALP